MINKEHEFSLKSLFIPLTTSKAIHIIIIIGLIVYFNMLFNGFVWDDLTYIIGNPELKGFNLVTLFGKNTFNSSGYFRPLPAVYFSLLYNLFGTSAFFYHFLQLVLHIICTSLIFIIFKQFFKQTIALILSLIFLVHPINVESVAYVGASQSEIYFFFGGMAFFLSMKGNLFNRRIILLHILLLCALLTKEISILFFFIIYLFRFIKEKDIAKNFIIITVFTLVLYLFIRLSVLGTVLEKMHLIPISEVPFQQRLFHIPIILFYYIKTFFFPKTLAIDQIWTISDISWNSFYLPLTIDLLFYGSLLAILYFLIRIKNKNSKIFIFFLLWYVSAMSMLLQIFPLDMTVADRWFYFPMVGLLGMLGICINSLAPFFEKRKKVYVICIIIVISLLSLRTIIRNNDWYNPLTLYSRDVQKYDNYDIENYLAVEYVYLNRYQDALPHVIKSTQLLPHDTNLYNLGSIYEHIKQYNQAKVYYKKALEIKSIFASHQEIRKLSYEGLCRLSVLYDQPEIAHIYAENATREFPGNGTLWAYRAISEYRLNNHERALAAAEKAKTIFPNPSTIKLYNRIQNKQNIDLRYE